jgi:hypothetical protein
MLHLRNKYDEWFIMGAGQIVVGPKYLGCKKKKKKNWADMSWSEVSLGQYVSTIWAKVSIFLGRNVFGPYSGFGTKRLLAEVSDIRTINPFLWGPGKHCLFTHIIKQLVIGKV